MNPPGGVLQVSGAGAGERTVRRVAGGASAKAGGGIEAVCAFLHPRL